jgi:hypothetical protein
MKILAKGKIGLWQEKWQKILFGIKLAENVMNCEDNGRKLLDSNHWGLIIVYFKQGRNYRGVVGGVSPPPQSFETVLSSGKN